MGSKVHSEKERDGSENAPEDASGISSQSTIREPEHIGPQDDPTEKALDDFEQEIRAAVDRWCDRFEERASRPVAEILDEAASAQERLIAAVDWAAAPASYRKGFRDEVLAPLEERLETAATEERLAESYRELLAELAEKPNALPATVTRAEPEALFVSESGDPATRRIRKARVRWGRAWHRGLHKVRSIPRRIRGNDPEEPDGPTQTIPLKHLATYHAIVRVPKKLEGVQEGLHQALGRVLADIAHAATEHGHEILLSERGEGEADLYDAAAKFAEALRLGASSAAVDDMIKDAETVAAGTMEEFRRDVRHSDTFMLDLAQRKVDDQARDDREDVWRRWHARVRARLSLTDTLLELREEMLTVGSSLAEHVLESAIDPARQALLSAEDALRRIEKNAAADFDGTGAGEQWRREDARSSGRGDERQLDNEERADRRVGGKGEGSGVRGQGSGKREQRDIAARVSRYLDEALSVVESKAITPLREGSYSEKAHEAAETTTSDMASRLHQLPETVQVNTLQAPDERVIDPAAAPLSVELREHASRAYDAIVLRRLQTAASVIADGLHDARETVAGIPDILRFNLEAAQEEAGKDLSAARELALGGLERSANVLREASQALSELYDPFRQQVSDVIEYGFERLHERLRVEVRMRGQILDLRSGALDQLRDVATEAADRARKSSILLRRAYLRGMRRGRALLQMGQEAAGLAEATEEERIETVEALADVSRLTEQLPLVYRRLFAFQPSTDPAMLQGRKADLAFIRKHVDLWLRGLTNVLVLHGYHGSGLTSLLNIARQSILKDADVSVLELRTRIRSEEELARRIRQTLNIKIADDTLEALEEEILTMEPTGIRACLVEHVEHLYLRQIGGTELIEEFLTFMSRTDANILWIVTTSDTAWQVITTAEPSAAGLVTEHGLFAISRSDLESIVLTRHKRSGLPLQFEPPENQTNPIVARRYRRAKTEQDKQAVLREDYFDKLFRATGQNIMLALLYWLRSVETDADEGVLRVRPLEPLRFSALEKFDLDRAFTLRALLEHTSLSVEEYSDIAQVPLEMSVQMFQTLGNLLLIEPFDSENGGQFQFFPIERGVSYRIRPLVIHPVSRFLRSRNILH